MINFFTLILLALLVLLQVILVTALFKNIHFSRQDKHYKNKELVRDVLEAILLVSVIFLLVYKYLQFVGISNKNSYKSAMVVVVVTLIVYGGINYNFFRAVYNENFSCKTIDDLQKKDIEFLTDDKAFSMVTSRDRMECSGKDIYAFGNLYPFHSIDIRNLPGHREEMVETVTAEFNSDKKNNFKLDVVPLDMAENEIVANN